MWVVARDADGTVDAVQRVASDGLVAAGAEHQPDRRLVMLVAHLLVDDVHVEVDLTGILGRNLPSFRSITT